MSVTISLKVHLKTVEAVYKSYMPFLKNGGLFIPSDRKCQLNDSVHLDLMLIEESNVFSVDGKVAWIMPELAQQARWVNGMGIQFDQHAEKVRAKIETLLVTADPEKPTNTM